MGSIYFIVNQRFTYVSTQLVLEWGGIVPKKTLYASYYDIEQKLDEFLMEFVDFGDKVFLIGFQNEKTDELVGIYNKYDFKTISSDSKDYKNPFEHAVKVVYPKLAGHITEKQKYYIKCVNSLIKNEFENKDAYLMGLIFYKITPDLFYDHFKNGYNTSNKYNNHILKHLKQFNKQSMDLFEVDGYYFVLSTVKFLGDYIYKFHKKVDNLAIIDLDGGRVYFKQLKDSDKNVNKLCKKYCKDIRGFSDFCSGEITEKFLKFTKEMKKYV